MNEIHPKFEGNSRTTVTGLVNIGASGPTQSGTDTISETSGAQFDDRRYRTKVTQENRLIDLAISSH